MPHLNWQDKNYTVKCGSGTNCITAALHLLLCKPIQFVFCKLWLSYALEDPPRPIAHRFFLFSLKDASTEPVAICWLFSGATCCPQGSGHRVYDQICITLVSLLFSPGERHIFTSRNRSRIPCCEHTPFAATLMGT